MDYISDTIDQVLICFLLRNRTAVSVAFPIPPAIDIITIMIMARGNFSASSIASKYSS